MSSRQLTRWLGLRGAPQAGNAALALVVLATGLACARKHAVPAASPDRPPDTVSAPATPAVADRTDSAVAALIEKALDPQAQFRAFAELEALGCDAAPAIIRRMDDRRPLPRRGLSLSNRAPGAFEGMRHYGPVQLVDALAAILNQVTGRSFGFIYHGATADERTKAVKGWQDYLRRVGPTNVCTKDGA